jgi:hypothetical protein
MYLRCLFFPSLRQLWKVPRWSSISKLQEFETRESPPLLVSLLCSPFALSSPRARNCARFMKAETYRKFAWHSVPPPALPLRVFSSGVLPPPIRLICTHASAHHRDNLSQSRRGKGAPCIPDEIAATSLDSFSQTTHPLTELNSQC